MKLRGFLCVLLVLLAVLSLCGCLQPTLTITTKAEFESTIGNLIDVSRYEYDSSSARYELDVAHRSEESTHNFTIDFKSASSISLPFVSGKLEESGWEKAAKSTHLLYDTYQNSKGESLFVDVSNNFLYANCDTHMLVIETYSYGEYKADYTRDVVKRKNVPKFIIAGKINNNSSISDVIATLGEPWSVNFDEEYVGDIPAVSLYFGGFRNGTFVGGLEITFSGETEEILNVCYTYLQYKS